MKYRLTITKAVLIQEILEADIPDSELAEMLDEDGNINEGYVSDYLWDEGEPISKREIKDLGDMEWEVEKVEGVGNRETL